LSEANPAGVNLKGIIILSISKFEFVETLYGAQMDSTLLNDIKDKCPYLLERLGRITE
jgi:hypothetical protein